MKKSIKKIITLSTSSLVLATALAACGKVEEIKGEVIYAAANADAKTGDGTKSNPYPFTIAFHSAKPGTTILLKEGVYEYDYRLEVGKDITEDNDTETGRAGKYITVRPEYDNDDVIFDFSKMAFGSNNRGIQIYSNYWHFYGITVRGAGDNGMYIAGNHNIVENCVFYNNRDTGLQIGRAYSEYLTIDRWPSYNLIKNCTSYANYDAETLGENADGYAAKLTVGYGNVFDGCIAFRNSDDGWDLFAKVDSGDIGTVVLKNCVSFENGFLPYKNDNETDTKFGTYDTLNGDGIGFKLGGSVMKGNVIVDNCLAFNNKLHGVGDNSNPGVISVKNFTAVNNCAGVDEEGKIRATRGLDGIVNKSNNIDLARSTNSYNNYYGIVSYVNNQKDYSTANDSEYNQDAYRGSTAYSIFNPSYDKGEKYVAYGDYEDASSWATDTVDTTFSTGKTYTDMNDEVFADLKPINATCKSREKLSDLVDIHEDYRNKDGSVNMGKKMKIVDKKLLTFANGNPIGAQLSKDSYDEYDHYPMYSFKGENSQDYNFDQVKILAARSVTEIIANKDAVFQNFIVPKQIAGADISWTSSKPEVLEIDNNETESKSKSVFSTVYVHTPKEDTKVTMTAKIKSGFYSVTKEIEVTVKGRKLMMGQVVSTGANAIRVNMYGVYNAPRCYALDGGAIGQSPLPESVYDLTYSYRYAKDGNSTFYDVDGVYTSVAGVYEVTATATMKEDGSKSAKVFKVYVVDPDSSIDFKAGSDPEISLTSEGYTVNGELSNIEGYIVSVTSKTQLSITKASELLALEGVQEYHVEEDYVSAPFIADNSVDNGAVQYYIYYAVVNGNKSANTDNNAVHEATINVKSVTTNEEFYSIARTGKLPSESSSETTTIYSLANDLDFTGFNWNTKTTSGVFTGLFRGNNHTISNITAKTQSKADYGESDASDAKSVNIFFKVGKVDEKTGARTSGTIMDVKFNKISILGDTETKQVGIVGELQGGYISNVRVTNITVTGKESVGGIVGQITSGYNYISKCSVENPLTEKTSLEEVNADNQYKITVKNKYAGGIVGNIQKNSQLVDYQLSTYISDCYASAIVGDGSDSGGKVSLIVGRVKNDNAGYYTNITRCAAYGLLISKGQYQSGLVGDFESGAGATEISNCLADVSFIYDGLYLNAQDAAKASPDAQQYAHKNSNPIVGRAVGVVEDGYYKTTSNIGSWAEYYSTDIVSTSIVFDMSNYYETGEFATLTETMVASMLKIDLENVWKFENGKVSLR